MILKVFEHQRIYIGQKLGAVTFTKAHHQALAGFFERKSDKYFTVLHNGVRFSHYVGALQIADMTIEVLPKTDRYGLPDDPQWQLLLLDMLRVCRVLKIDTQRAALLRLRPHSILDLYYEWYVEELSLLMRRGLLKSYQLVNERLTVLKGQIDFPRQVARAALEEAHFYTRHQQYTYDHLLNQILHQTLVALRRLSLDPTLQQRIQVLLACFPPVAPLRVTERHFQLVSDQKLFQTCRRALDMARLILLNYSADIRGGRQHQVALMFDMNLLFEEYVFRKLQQATAAGWRISRQSRRPFWKRRFIRPDILLAYQGRKWVLDTKWKILTNKRASGDPDMTSLKQMYVYCRFFGAGRAVLLYPRAGQQAHRRAPVAYQPAGSSDERIYCQQLFLEVIREGKLNKLLGEEILQQILEYG